MLFRLLCIVGKVVAERLVAPRIPFIRPCGATFLPGGRQLGDRSKAPLLHQQPCDGKLLPLHTPQPQEHIIAIHPMQLPLAGKSEPR